MKKIVSAAGLAALGAVGLHAAAGDGLSRIESSKPWSIKANLRGFYDDNIITMPSAWGSSPDSFGFELSPSLSYNLVKEQTLLSAGYQYTLRWFDDRDPDNSDHNHSFNLGINHDINQNLSLSLTDQFVIAQEPEVIDPTGATRFRALRADSDALRNSANLSLTAQLSDTLSLVGGYKNDLINYDADGDGSFSALLDRVEHRLSANLRTQLRPATSALVGYQYRIVDYTSDDLLQPGGSSSDVRNSDSHYVYAGVDHAFSPELSTSLRAGAQFTTYDNANVADDSTVSPYIDANLSYAYAKGSNLSVGLRHERNQTDIPYFLQTLILDQETTSIYASVTHQLTAKLTANLVGMYAMSSFGDSLPGSPSDDYLSLGANVAYTINQYLQAETGYNFDDLSSDLGRSFDRNRVYVGLKASY